MTWCRVGSSPATAARTATVFPAPTSPVITPSRIWSMQKLIRAVAWAWAWRANRALAAIAFPNGGRASPKCAAHGAPLATGIFPPAPGPGRAPGERLEGVGFPCRGRGRHRGPPRAPRPANRSPDGGRVRLPVRPGRVEPVEGGWPGLGVHPPVGDLPGPRREPVVELIQRLD